jgi:hypothetical protein
MACVEFEFEIVCECGDQLEVDKVDYGRGGDVPIVTVYSCDNCKEIAWDDGFEQGKEAD